MAILKRTLYLQALAWGASGLALAVAPGPVLEGLLGQPRPSEDAWIRVAGIEGLVLALLMVMVGHRIQTHWWWSWAFAILSAGVAAVFTLNALAGVPEGAAVWPWWAFSVADWAFAFTLTWGLARAGQENPIV